jgi:hypothetical protein
LPACYRHGGLNSRPSPHLKADLCANLAFARTTRHRRHYAKDRTRTRHGMLRPKASVPAVVCARGERVRASARLHSGAPEDAPPAEAELRRCDLASRFVIDEGEPDAGLRCCATIGRGPLLHRRRPRP